MLEVFAVWSCASSGCDGFMTVCVAEWERHCVTITGVTNAKASESLYAFEKRRTTILTKDSRSCISPAIQSRRILLRLPSRAVAVCTASRTRLRFSALYIPGIGVVQRPIGTQPSIFDWLSEHTPHTNFPLLQVLRDRPFLYTHTASTPSLVILSSRLYMHIEQRRGPSGEAMLTM
jgi:hypothetical protein